MVGGAFGVALTLGSEVLVSHIRVGRRDQWLGWVQSFLGLGRCVLGSHWPEREQPVGSSLFLPRRGAVLCVCVYQGCGVGVGILNEGGVGVVICKM